jgi:hypothetical protein
MNLVMTRSIENQIYEEYRNIKQLRQYTGTMTKIIQPMMTQNYQQLDFVF